MLTFALSTERGLLSSASPVTWQVDPWLWPAPAWDHTSFSGALSVWSWLGASAAQCLAAVPGGHEMTLFALGHSLGLE